jgi:hypothetical protein
MAVAMEITVSNTGRVCCVNSFDDDMTRTSCSLSLVLMQITNNIEKAAQNY